MKKRLLIIAQVVLLALLGNSVIAGATLSTQPVANLKSAQAQQTVTQAQPLTPVGSGFTYQGQLKQGGNPAGGQYDLVFTLYDALTGGNQISQPVTQTNMTVTGGLFSVTLDFGAGAFNGDGRWLEIAVRQTGGGSYTTLSPRQPLLPSPYALFALKTQGYKNVVVVAKAGGDFTSVQAALDSITDSSADNPYLVWVGPGTYTETVTMKPYVDIEGAGEDVATITYTSAGPTVVGASNAELRFLTVRNTGGGANAVAITVNNTSLSHVAAIASGGVYNTGLHVDNSVSTTISDVAVAVSGGTYSYGVLDQESSLHLMTNMTVTATGGTYNYGVYVYASSLDIQKSVVSGTTYAVYNASGVDYVRVADSQLLGPHFSLVKCAGVYDANYTFYPGPSCP